MKLDIRHQLVESLANKSRDRAIAPKVYPADDNLISQNATVSRSVFRLDLKPLIKIINPDTGCLRNDDFHQYSRKILARDLAMVGSFKNLGGDKFLLCIDRDDADGWIIATRIVNNIGEHFLGGLYKPDIVLSKALNLVEPNVILRK